MPLSAGSHLGPYEIVAPLGAGGMGEVYRARDTNLNREVAVKVLPAGLAADDTRMARFQREAELLAALNHPNIAAIYGIERGAIVMELVEGQDLHGPVPIDTALNYARQIAVALEAAHEKGIVHRDLKPANIKVTPDGTIKLLDFGLAKATEESASGIARPNTMSPTLSLAMTEAGMILGTAAYMAPEQARGKPVDRRADIWAFGVILYEMLAGASLFGGGETVSDSLAAVITKEPDWKALPADTPPRIRRLLERCLAKDPKTRLQAIGEARIALDQPDDAPAAAAPASRPAMLVWTLAGVALVCLLAAGAAWLRPRAADPGLGPVRFSLTFPEGTREPGSPATPQAVPSPDGRLLAFVATDSTGLSSLWVRSMDSLSAHKLDKTENANFPFWSPDSRFIAYFAEEKLRRVAVAGGSPQVICDVPGSRGSYSGTQGDGGTWNREGQIVFATRAGTGLMRVPAAGGLATEVTKVDNAAGEQGHSWPQFLPDGRHLLYLALNLSPEKSGIYVQELGSAQRTLVLHNATRGAWSEPGYLLFVRESTLLARRMNPRTFQVEGEPVSVTQEVTENNSNGRSAFAVSERGMLAYHGGALFLDRRLNWLDRDGKPLGAVGKVDQYRSVALSPDEKSLAVVVGSAAGGDTWIVNLATGVPTRMTSALSDSLNPSPWSPDSQHMAINGVEGGIRELDVASGKLTPLASGIVADDWSPDGLSLLCNDRAGRRLSLLPLAAGSKPQSILDTSYTKRDFRFSPDGKWVVYVSSEPGPQEVFVASFPTFAAKKQVSTAGGFYPAWRKDGKAVYFRSADTAMMMAEVRTTPQLEVGSPKQLFSFGVGTTGNRFAVTKDGRFLFADRLQHDNSPSEIVVVVNWLAGLPEQR